MDEFQQFRLDGRVALVAGGIGLRTRQAPAAVGAMVAIAGRSAERPACSDASAFVTGKVLTLDGGLTATQ
jgi:hypothetical protein